MEKKRLVEKAQVHLHRLCTEIGERRVGSPGNRQATAYAEKVLKERGWNTETTELSVMDWKTEGITLTCNGKSFIAFSSPYSLGCAVNGALVAIERIEQLEQLEQSDINDKIVLLHGEISAQQIAPKHFPFWNPEAHQHLIALLEKSHPKALICATGRDSATAGGAYPYPLFEDGDFDIPSVYMKDTEGERMLAHTGHTAELISKAERIPETAYNLIATQPGHHMAASNLMSSPSLDSSRYHTTALRNLQPSERIVISAHIDAKIGTPGAIDNGTGVTILLLLAELLNHHPGNYPIELVFFNGEDYYSAPGQVKYLEQNAEKLKDILLNINIDGAGYKEGLSCFSPFELPDRLNTALQQLFRETPEIVEGLPWYQGDHSIFLQNGRPAIAVSSQWFIEHMESQEITHTPKDRPEIVDYEKVADCALGIAAFIRKL